MNTKVNIAGVEFKNPVMVASGTFGSGAEYGEFVDLNRFCLLYTSPSPRDMRRSRMPSSA